MITNIYEPALVRPLTRVNTFKFQSVELQEKKDFCGSSSQREIPGRLCSFACDRVDNKSSRQDWNGHPLISNRGLFLGSCSDFWFLTVIHLGSVLKALNNYQRIVTCI